MIPKKIVLAGNPNVGKSTVFNYLTGMKQHTGNWSGKTVGTSEGIFRHNGKEIKLIDLPGTYSLAADSPEEEVTRNYLCFEKFDGAIVICDACCLERNLIFALQVSQLVPNILLCVNMLDDAKRKGIEIDFEKLSEETGLPVVGISAANSFGMDELSEKIFLLSEGKLKSNPLPLRYPKDILDVSEKISAILKKDFGIGGIYPSFFLAGNNSSFLAEFEKYYGAVSEFSDLNSVLSENIAPKDFFDKISACTAFRAEEICISSVRFKSQKSTSSDKKIDSFLTGKLFGIPAMLILFGFIFWLTVSGANYPSALLSSLFSKAGEHFDYFLSSIGTPVVLKSFLLDGIWNVLSWVVAVMLPPMAIFFPLFTFLEDIGYLPRVAFNLDKCFYSAGTCGKQVLTMCMGIGCGAVGVTGTRIIDSPRERIIATVTNSFMPCNGRLPAIIALTAMFFTDSSVLGTVILTCSVVLSVLMTFVVSKILSKTVLKGVPSGFVLELPPYRMPKIGKIIVRSVFDRTLKILGRAVLVAVPAGAIIWLCSNLFIGEKTVISAAADFLDPFASFFGIDGNVLCGFILSFPANEIALPIMAMGYSGGVLEELGGISETAFLFYKNGFDSAAALCTIVLMLFHWPCATTLITVMKETKSIKWTLLSVAVPLVTGLCLCFIINIVSKLFA